MAYLDDRRGVVFDLQPLWVDAVEHVLAGLELRVVGTTTSPSRALELVAEHRPDIFLAGIDCNGSPGGVELVRRVREFAPRTQVIALATDDDPVRVEDTFAAGATAYVLRTARGDDLAAAVRQAFGHSIYFADSRSPRAVPREAPAAHVGLTRRELEILSLAAQGHSNLQLARMLWVTEQTVKFHLSNVYRKLGVANRTEASRWARVNGLFAEESADSGVGDAQAARRDSLVHTAA